MIIFHTGTVCECRRVPIGNTALVNPVSILAWSPIWSNVMKEEVYEILQDRNSTENLTRGVQGEISPGELYRSF